MQLVCVDPGGYQIPLLDVGEHITQIDDVSDEEAGAIVP
jgi:hypothetical protein